MGTIAQLDVNLGLNVGAFTASAGKARGAMTDLGSVADRVYRDTRTSAEVFQERLSQLGGLYSRGQINAETYGRAVRKLRDEMSGAAEKAADFARNAAAQQKEALAAAARQASQLADAMARGGQVTRSVMTPVEAYVHRMRELAELLRVGAINQQTFTRAGGQAVAQMRAASGASASGASALRQIGAAALGFAGPVGLAIAAVLAAKEAISGLSHAAANGAVHALQLAANYEKAEIALTTVFRSSEKAKQVLAEVVKFADRTPFEFPELKDAAVKLGGFGVQAEQILPTLRVLGDLAAGTGARVEELAETYGKARIQGRAYTRDINEFANRGIPIWEALAKSQNASQEAVHGMVEAGLIGFPELQRALIGLTAEGGMFEGALARQAEGLSGLWSTLTDSVEANFRELGLAIAREFDLKAAVQQLTEFADAMKADAVPAIVDLTRDLGDLLNTLNEAGLVFGGVDLSLRGMAEQVRQTRSFLLGLSAGFARLTGDAEKYNARMAEIFEMQDRAANGPQKSGAPAPLAIEERGPDTTLVDSVAKLNQELSDSIRTFGLSANAIKVWELQQQGATREQLAFASAAARQLEAMKAQRDMMKETAKAAEDLRKKESELVAELQKKIATFGKSAEAERLFDFEMQHGVTAASQQARALLEQLEVLRAHEKATKAAAKAQEELREKAQRIIEDAQTPLQKFQAREAELHDLVDKGAMTREQAFQAWEKARKDLIADKNKTGRGDVEAKPGALLKGSAAAFSAANRLGGGGSEAAKTRAVLSKEARETNRHLRALEKANRRKEQLRVIQNFN